MQWIRYPIPYKHDLIRRIQGSKIYSKFDMKSGFWQIQIKEEDRYKTAFTTPFGHYEWNVMPFGLKNAPSEFQKIMNEIFLPYTSFIIVYIDDVLIFSQNIDQHWKHLNIFHKIIIQNGLVVSARKMKLFQTHMQFLGYKIQHDQVLPVARVIEFSDKFPDEIKERKQLQRFLGCLNYVSDFYEALAKDRKILTERLKKNPPAWTPKHTQAVKQIKSKVKRLPCLYILDQDAFKIIETDASDYGYGGILKQRKDSKEQLVRFTSGTWNDAQKNYSTIKKEILAIVKVVSKFQGELLNQKFLLRIDCKAAKDVLQKDVENLVSKQIFARWQAILSCFDFNIEHIKGEMNSLPDFLSREFLQGYGT